MEENTVASQDRAKEYQASQLRLSMIEEICTILFLILWVYLAQLIVPKLADMNHYLALIIRLIPTLVMPAKTHCA